MSGTVKSLLLFSLALALAATCVLTYLEKLYPREPEITLEELELFGWFGRLAALALVLPLIAIGVWIVEKGQKM